MIKRGIMFSNRVVFQKPDFKELKKEYALVDMHVHSEYSHDGITPINSLIKRAKKLGIGLAITDHLRAEGAIKAAKQKRVLIIPGIEISAFENREILLYFYSVNDLKDYYEKYLKNKIIVRKPEKAGLIKTFTAVRSRMKMKEVIEKADNYNCLKSIAHPYTYLNKSSYLFFARKKRAGLLRRIEAVEVLTTSHRRFMNKMALKWALKRKKGFTAGSDAHNLSEFGSAVVASKSDRVEGFLESIKKKKNLVIGKEIRFPSVLKTMLKTLNYKRKRDWSKVIKL